MPRTTSFNADWLLLKDANGNAVGEWCSWKDENGFTAYCSVCKKSFDFRNRGKHQVLQHALTKKHQTLSSSVLRNNQSKLSIQNVQDGGKKLCLDHPGKTSLAWNMDHEDKVSKAEIIWTLKVATCGYSYASCNNVSTEFKEMFPDSNIASDMKLSAAKLSYEISHGLGPHFHEEMVKHVNEAGALYTISFDETTNAAGNKQLDLHLRAWNEKTQRVENKFLKSYMLGHATSDILKEKIFHCLKQDKLKLGNLLMLSSDGPSVNLKLLNDIDDILKKQGHPGLVRFGSCTLHIVHNSFGHGLKNCKDWKIEEFLDSLFKYFHKFPARKEDFQHVQRILELKESAIMRYVSNRWLSLLPVIERVLEQWNAIKHYFLEVVPKSKKCGAPGFYYNVIVGVLRDNLTLPRLHFLKSIAAIYSRFLTVMQMDEPLIHILYDELLELSKTLLSRFMKPEVYEGIVGKRLTELQFNDTEHLLPLQKVNVGVSANDYLKSVNESKRKEFKLEARQFLVNVTRYLLQRVPLGSPLIRNLKCLHPLFQTNKDGIICITKVAEGLPLAVSRSDLDSLQSEWRIYASLNVSRKQFVNSEGINDDGKVFVQWRRVDDYWADILKEVTSVGSPKFPYLGKLTKAALTLSHGQAHVERGFSINNHLVSQSRPQLSEESINGARSIQDAVLYYSEPTKVPITLGTLRAYRNANRLYKQDLEIKKKQKERKAADELAKEEMLLKRKAQGEERNCLLTKEAELQKGMEDANNLLQEANTRLSNACKSRNIKEIVAAQALVEAGHQKISNLTTKLKEAACSKKLKK